MKTNEDVDSSSIGLLINDDARHPGRSKKNGRGLGLKSSRQDEQRSQTQNLVLPGVGHAKPDAAPGEVMQCHSDGVNENISIDTA